MSITHCQGSSKTDPLLTTANRLMTKKKDPSMIARVYLTPLVYQIIFRRQLLRFG